jgi:hypothetical protein
MLGFDLKNEDRGIIPRSVHHILEYINTKICTKFKINCSYLEIYNEKIYDLLVTGKQLKTQNLEIREDRVRGVYVQDLTLFTVTKQEHIFQLMERGAMNRSMAATNMNERSSRSHTIFQMHIEQEDKTKTADSVVKVSKLNLVDLAGSEKWDTFGGKISDIRVQELTSINQSLSALGLCIASLMQSGRSHIPFRDSKLTRLLQDSLGGNTKTVFVATVSPSVLAFEETHSTLKFADRAKRVVMTTRVNEVVEDAVLVKRCEKEIARLRGLLKAKRGNDDELKKCKDEITILKKENEQLQNLLKKSGFKPATGSSNLPAKSSDVSKKLTVLREIENDQRERETELEQYHSWLHSIPVKYDGEEYSLELRNRLKLMEQSVKMQSGELIRTKKLFMRDLKIVKDELAEKSSLIEKLEVALEIARSEPTESKESEATDSTSGEHTLSTNVRSHLKQEFSSLVEKFEAENSKLDSNMKHGMEAFRANMIGLIEEEVSDKSIHDDLNQIVIGCSEALEETVLTSADQFAKFASSTIKKLIELSLVINQKTTLEAEKTLKQSKELVSEDNLVENIRKCLKIATEHNYPQSAASSKTQEYWNKVIQQAEEVRDFQSRMYTYTATIRGAVLRILSVIRKFERSDFSQLEYQRQYLEQVLHDMNRELKEYEYTIYPEASSSSVSSNERINDYTDNDEEDEENTTPQKDVTPKKLSSTSNTSSDTSYSSTDSLYND